jgi:2-keto-3-deoxy-L-rhamnonate aldolase RhmA
MVFEFFSPGIAQVLKLAGCEFIIYDMEHGGEYRALGFNMIATGTDQGILMAGVRSILSAVAA